MTNGNKRHQLTNLKAVNVEILVETEPKLKRWKEYVEELFNDDRLNKKPMIDTNTKQIGPAITKSEIILSIKT